MVSGLDQILCLEDLATTLIWKMSVSTQEQQNMSSQK